jgi:hypothetical protein
LAELDALEKRLFDIFAKELDDHHSNAGSNDFEWPSWLPLEKRKEIMIELSKDQPDDYMLGFAEDDYVFDFMVFEYLRKKILK